DVSGRTWDLTLSGWRDRRTSAPAEAIQDGLAFPDAFRQTGNRKNLLRVRDFLSEQPMPYQYRGWTLYAYDVPGEDETTIYFFSESKPKQGVALEGPPAGMEAALGNDGLPTLIEHGDVTALRKVDPFEFEDRIRKELDARPAK